MKRWNKRIKGLDETLNPDFSFESKDSKEGDFCETKN